MADSFTSLIAELIAEQDRRDRAPRRQPSAPDALEMAHRAVTGGPQKFAKALSTQLAEASTSIQAFKVKNLRPGMGVRCIGRPGGFQVTDLDPARGRVAVRLVEDNAKWPVGVNFDDPAPTWIEANACERAPEFDAPDVDISDATMAKALDASSTRREQEQRLASIKARSRELVTEVRSRLMKAFDAGEISPSDARRSEIALNHYCERFGL